MPTEFGEDRRTFFFRGVSCPGASRQPPPGLWPRSWGGRISRTPGARHLPSSVPRWGTCPRHLPKRADPCLEFDFSRGSGTRGLAAASPQGSRGRRIHRETLWVMMVRLLSIIIGRKVKVPRGLRQAGEQPVSPSTRPRRRPAAPRRDLAHFAPASAALRRSQASTGRLRGRWASVWGRSPASFVHIHPSVLVATPGVSVPRGS